MSKLAQAMTLQVKIERRFARRLPNQVSGAILDGRAKKRGHRLLMEIKAGVEWRSVLEESVDLLFCVQVLSSPSAVILELVLL